MRNRKYIIACLLGLLTVISIYAQSIKLNNNTNSVLLIDPLEDTNGTTGTDDDVIISPNGYVGIGTHTPVARLDIRGTLRIKDGSELQDAFLISDADGVAFWLDGNFIGRRIEEGKIVTAKSLTSNYQDVTSSPLELGAGLWLIVAKADVEGTVTSTTLTTAEYVWMKIVEETTQTNGTKTYVDVSEGGLPYSIRKSMYQKYYSTPMVQGFLSVPMEGTSQKKRIYTIQMKNPSADFTNAQLTSDLSGAYFYAIKLQ